LKHLSSLDESSASDSQDSRNSDFSNHVLKSEILSYSQRYERPHDTLPTPLPYWNGVRDYKRVRTPAQDSLVSRRPVSMFNHREGSKRMPDSKESFRLIVDNWLTDVKRRGADLYAANEGDEVQYFSFEGKNHFRFSLEIDYALQEIAVQITDPTTGGMEVENLTLTAKNLDALARLMCSVKEGEAVVPVYLLAQLAVICHGYQRLVQELDQVHGIETTTGSVTEIEADLRRFLTPEEQKRTNNPLLTKKGKTEK
jgi:hypothetical protein